MENLFQEHRSAWVQLVESLTGDQRVAGLSFTCRVTVLCL